MSPDKDKELCRKFPKLYADRHADMKVTAMCWGFDIGDGWFDIIYRLSKKLESLIEKEPIVCSYCGHASDCHSPICTSYFMDTDPCDCNTYKESWPKASQVKEKFGTLRFYMTFSTDEMEEAIEEAEKESARTCEMCGKAGILRDDGWLKVLCDRCEDSRY